MDAGETQSVLTSGKRILAKLLTVDLGVVRAAVEEDAHSLCPTIVHLIIVDVDVFAALGGDNSVVHVHVDLVSRYGQVVGVIVRVKAVLDVVVHRVVGPYATLVAVRVHTVVHVMDVGVLDVAVHVSGVEYLEIALVGAESADFPRQAIRLGIEES